MNLLFLDLETTGLDPEKHEVIELAGMLVVNNIVKEEFSLFFKPTNFDIIEQDALRTTGYTVEKLMALNDNPVVSLMGIDALLKKYGGNEIWTLAGQKTTFDRSFFNKFWARYQPANVRLFRNVFSFMNVDLINIATTFHLSGVYTFENFKLDTILKTLGMEFDGNHHSAIDDVKNTYKAYAFFMEKLKQIPVTTHHTQF